MALNEFTRNYRIFTPIIETAEVLILEGQDTPTPIRQFFTYPEGNIDGCDALTGCLERFSEYDIGRNRMKTRSFVIPA